MSRKEWTVEEENLLVSCYREKKSIDKIASLLNRTQHSITAKAQKLGLSKKYVKNNNSKFKAIYQDYEWCYQKYITENKTHKEMANEANCSVRVIQKWCSEKHKLNRKTYKRNKHLSPKQRELIMFSLLGDGHITKKDQPTFIITHADNQKDYLYWKYDILKDLCATVPKHYAPPSDSSNDYKKCKYQSRYRFYRFGTKIINDLIPIREMPKNEIINQLNEFGICVHLLDDASRSHSNWVVCVASFTETERDLYITKCKENLGLNCKKQKDNRYIAFDAVSSRKIDDLMLTYFPNDLDIIKYKIINNNISRPANYFFVRTNNGNIGLNRYCRKNKLPYLKIKKAVNLLQCNELDEYELLRIAKEYI